MTRPIPDRSGKDDRVSMAPRAGTLQCHTPPRREFGRARAWVALAAFGATPGHRTRVYSTRSSSCRAADRSRLNSHSFAKDSRCARLGGLGLLARTRLTTRLTGRVLIIGECAPCSYSNGPRQLTRRHPDPHQPLISRRRARGRCSSTQYRDSRSPKRQRARNSPPNRTWAALAPARAVSAELATVDCCC